jgi:hypothetical protein
VAVIAQVQMQPPPRPSQIRVVATHALQALTHGGNDIIELRARFYRLHHISTPCAHAIPHHASVQLLALSY